MNLFSGELTNSQIASALLALIIVNAITTAALVWLAFDLRDYRRFHRAEMNELRDLYAPKISVAGSKMRRNTDDHFLVGVEAGIEEKGVGGFGDRWKGYPVEGILETKTESGFRNRVPIIMGDETAPSECNEGDRMWWRDVPAICVSHPIVNDPGTVEITLMSGYGSAVTTRVVQRSELTTRTQDCAIDHALPGLYGEDKS